MGSLARAVGARGASPVSMPAKGCLVKRSIIRAAIATLVLVLPVIFSPKASAETRWVCDVPGEGFGETCHGESG